MCEILPIDQFYEQRNVVQETLRKIDDFEGTNFQSFFKDLAFHVTCISGSPDGYLYKGIKYKYKAEISWSKNGRTFTHEIVFKLQDGFGMFNENQINEIFNTQAGRV